MPSPQINTGDLTQFTRPELEALAKKSKGSSKVIDAIEREIRRRKERRETKRRAKAEHPAAVKAPMKPRHNTRHALTPPAPNEDELTRLRRELAILRDGVSEIAELLARWGLTTAAPEEVEAMTMAHWDKKAPKEPDAFGRSKARLATDIARIAVLRKGVDAHETRATGRT